MYIQQKIQVLFIVRRWVKIYHNPFFVWLNKNTSVLSWEILSSRQKRHSDKEAVVISQLKHMRFINILHHVMYDFFKYIGLHVDIGISYQYY